MQIFQDTNFDFIGKQKITIGLSLILIVIGIVSIFFHKGLNYGIDFSGGTIVQVQFKTAVTAEDVRKALNDPKLGTFMIQQIGEEDSHEFMIRLPLTADTEIDDTPAAIIAGDLEQTFGKDFFEIRKTDVVGPTMGEELKKSAKLSILWALLAILVYITFRFELQYAIGAVTALIHDVMIIVGAFSLMNREFNLPVVAALLTVVGYSLNDTIIIYDRIRENRKLHPRKKLAEIMNLSINQTLSRTILTSLTTLFVVLALYFFGGAVINDFAFAMLFGVVFGTYSTIFIASPIVLGWSKLISPRAPKRK